jgi:hypothetical protein
MARDFDVVTRRVRERVMPGTTSAPSERGLRTMDRSQCWLGGSVLVCALLLSTAGCGDDSASKGTMIRAQAAAGSSASMNAGADAVAKSVCDSCSNTNCAGPLDGCSKTEECRALLTCANACAGEGMCLQDCAAMFPGSVGGLIDIFDCRELRCAAECPPAA